MFLTSSSSSATVRNQESALSLGLGSSSSRSSLSRACHPQDCPCLLSDLHCCSLRGALQSRKQSVPFYRSYNTSPWIGSLPLVTLVVHDGILPSVGTVVLCPLYILEGRQ
jgi:hypothetical protein